MIELINAQEAQKLVYKHKLAKAMPEVEKFINETIAPQIEEAAKQGKESITIKHEQNKHITFVLDILQQNNYKTEYKYCGMGWSEIVVSWETIPEWTFTKGQRKNCNH